MFGAFPLASAPLGAFVPGAFVYHQSDSATAADAGVVSASVPVTDSATATDAGVVYLTAVDGAAADDRQSKIGVSYQDGATGTEDDTATQPGSQSPTGRDYATADDMASVSATIPASDSATGAEAATVHQVCEDGAAAADAGGLTAHLTATDAAHGFDSEWKTGNNPASVAQMRDSSRIQPVYLVQIALNGGGPTLYFSDRNITVGSQIYESYLKDVEGIGNEIMRATSQERDAGVTLSFKNDAFQNYAYLIQIGDTYPFQGAICTINEIYENDLNGTQSEQTIVFKGALNEPQDVDLFSFTCKVSRMPWLMDRRWKQTLVTYNNYPNVFEDAGKYLPIVYGHQVLLPAVRTDWGARTTLADAVAAGDTQISLSDTRRFPNSGQIAIDHEIITYAAKQDNNLTGLTRGVWPGSGAGPHRNGATVWQNLPAYDSIIAAHPLANIIYIFAEYQGKLWLVQSGVSSYVDGSGFTHLSMGQYLTVDGLLDYIGVDDTIGINDDGHLHTPSPAKSDYTTSFDVATEYQEGDAGIYFDLSFPPGIAGALYTYHASFSISVDPSSQVNIGNVQVWFAAGNEEIWITAGQYTQSFEWELASAALTGAQVGMSTVDGTPMTGTLTVNSCTVRATAATSINKVLSNVAKSGTVSKVGTVIETHMIERLHAVVNGYADDANGTYTGTPGAIITQPQHVLKHFLCVPTGGVFNVNEDFDLTSFNAAGSAYAGLVPSGFNMAFVIQEEIKPSRFVQKLAFEARSVLDYGGDGLWRLNVVPDLAPAAVRTIESADLAGKGAMFRFSYTSTGHIWNDISLQFCKLYSRLNIADSDWLGSLEVADSASQALYGLMPRNNLQFETIRDTATAQNVLNHILIERKTPHLVVEFETFWENFDLALGQTIAISNELWNGKLFFIQSITRRSAAVATIKAVGWW